MLCKPVTSKPCNSERYVLGLGLTDRSAAIAVANELDEVLGRLQAPSEPRRFVHTLGLSVPDATHRAFDSFSLTQRKTLEDTLSHARQRNFQILEALAAQDARTLRLD